MRRLAWGCVVTVFVGCSTPTEPKAKPCTWERVHTVDTVGWVSHLDGRPPSPILAGYCGGARPQ